MVTVAARVRVKARFRVMARVRVRVMDRVRLRLETGVGTVDRTSVCPGMLSYKFNNFSVQKTQSAYQMKLQIK